MNSVQEVIKNALTQVEGDDTYDKTDWAGARSSVIFMHLLREANHGPYTKRRMFSRAIRSMPDGSSCPTAFKAWLDDILENNQ